MARSVKSSWWGVYSLLMLGALQEAAGEWAEARQTLAQGLAIAERDADLQARRAGSLFLASLDVHEGRAEAAIALLEPLLDRPETAEQDVAELRPVCAEAYLASGSETKAEAVLDDALRRAKEQDLKLELAEALRVQGMLRTAQSRWDDAETAFDEALTLAQAMPNPHLEARIFHAFGAMLLAKGETNRARERLQAALDIFQRLGAPAFADRTARILNDLG
jgi:tetratricopeptide (TPR) repeat protein